MSPSLLGLGGGFTPMSQFQKNEKFQYKATSLKPKILVSCSLNKLKEVSESLQDIESDESVEEE